MDPLENITIEALDVSLSRSNAKKAKGVDSLRPLELQRLPVQEKLELIAAVAGAGGGQGTKCQWPGAIFARRRNKVEKRAPPVPRSEASGHCDARPKAPSGQGPYRI